MPEPKEETCPRCQKLRKLGPWNADGFTKLCGACKVQLTFARPGFKEKLEAGVKAAFAVPIIIPKDEQ